MPRKKKKPGYNPEVSMEELVSAIAHAYGSYDDRKEVMTYREICTIFLPKNGAMNL